MKCRLSVIAVLVGALASAAGAADHPVGGDALRIRDPDNSAGRSARFRAVRDLAISPSLANDPRVLDATIEISGSGPGDGSTGPLTLAGSLWKGLGNPEGSKGFRYVDSTASTGIKRVVFRSGNNGGSLLVVGRGSSWPYAITQPQGQINVHFQIGSEVYCAKFNDFRRNETGSVIARKASPPADCGPAVCGNGTLEGAEECDDNNTNDSDGCSSACQLENTSAICAGVTPVSGTALSSVLVADGLDSPVHIAAPRLDPNRVFVVEQPGTIRIIKNGTLLASPFLDIQSKVGCCGERGLLSVAFHPNFETNGRFFVDYTNNSGNTVIARYEVAGDPDDAPESSEKILLTITQPFSNHNGGQLAFGPDGYLYVGMGDGGSGGDPLENGQNDGALLGKMLRLDADVETSPYYAIPATNPFLGAGYPLDEIWAKGLRNPWRFSFDRGSGDLYIADVGQGQWEEIDYQPAASAGGENYGWDIFEGNHCYDPQPDFADCPDPPTDFTMPVHEYDHGEGCSITGGFVYRGCRMPDLQGAYFYSDYCSAFVRTFNVVGGVAQNHMDRTSDVDPGGGLSINSVTSFGEDARGEIYIADQGGEVFKIVPGN